METVQENTEAKLSGDRDMQKQSNSDKGLTNGPRYLNSLTVWANIRWCPV